MDKVNTRNTSPYGLKTNMKISLKKELSYEALYSHYAAYLVVLPNE